jgi:hypothetical protein
MTSAVTISRHQVSHALDSIHLLAQFAVRKQTVLKRAEWYRECAKEELRATDRLKAVVSALILREHLTIRIQQLDYWTPCTQVQNLVRCESLFS